jgi:ATP-dependent DNA helicase DinG
MYAGGCYISRYNSCLPLRLSDGGRSFFDYSVPQAVISLKQGVGRLIRSTTDRGVIAILDPRLRTKSYGRDFLNSLPRMRITGDLDEVEKIFD